MVSVVCVRLLPPAMSRETLNQNGMLPSDGNNENSSHFWCGNKLVIGLGVKSQYLVVIK